VTVHHLIDVDNELFNPDDQLASFFTGQSAMATLGPWSLAVGASDHPEFADAEYALLPPLFGNTHRFTTDAGWGLVVNATSVEKDEAWKLVRFIAEDAQNALAWNIKSGTLPALRANASSQALAQSSPALAQALTLLPLGHYVGPLPGHDRLFYEVIAPHVLLVLGGQETERAALASIDDEANTQFR
jgi:multiple sugar transport system substrate-binding protein